MFDDFTEKDKLRAVVQTTEFDNYDQPVFPDRYDMNFTYSGGSVVSQWFTDGRTTWTKTFSYDGGGNVVKISRWIRS